MENEKNNIIGERLKFLRKSKKVKVAEITDYLDIARSTYNGYEYGSRKPDSDKLVLLAEVFNTSVDYITGKTDIETPTNDLREILTSNELVYNGHTINEGDRELIARIIDGVLKDKES